jgi:LPS export ABC transporter protein LptC
VGKNHGEIRMKKSKLIILCCMGAILVAVGGYLLFGGHGDEEDEAIIAAVQKKADENPDVTLENIHYVETKGKKKEWELRAKSGQHFLQDDYTTLNDISVTFYAEGGRTVTLTGGKGSMKGRKEIEVSDHVVITSSDGYRVVTSSLHYDAQRKQIFNQDPVLLEGKGVRIKGIGVVVDLQTKKLSILRKVETVIEG